MLTMVKVEEGKGGEGRKRGEGGRGMEGSKGKSWRQNMQCKMN